MKILNENTSALRGGLTHFGLELLGRLPKDENAFISPFSIASALSLAMAGANGDTFEQMKDVLGFGDMAALELLRQRDMSTGSVRIDSANAALIDEKLAVKDSYLSFVGEACEMVRRVDFKDAEAVCDQVNKWVSEKTRGLISDLLSPDMIRATAMVLANAVYFKADWAVPFNARHTSQSPFFNDDGTEVVVDMMYRKGDDIPFFSNSIVKAAALPYGDGSCRMVIALPEKGTSLADALAASLRTRFVERDVRMYIPKFSESTEYMLASHLREMGMPNAFVSGEADFSGIAESNDLFVGGIVHKAKIEVDEKGSEAAAATAMCLRRCCESPDMILRADRSFAFAIVDNNSIPLFMGAIRKM